MVSLQCMDHGKSTFLTFSLRITPLKLSPPRCQISLRNSYITRMMRVIEFRPWSGRSCTSAGSCHGSRFIYDMVVIDKLSMGKIKSLKDGVVDANKKAAARYVPMSVKSKGVKIGRRFSALLL